MTYSSHAALDLKGRWLKAEKIRRLLPLSEMQKEEIRLLEIGTGSGAIASYFAGLSSPLFKVSAVDVMDQRTIVQGFDFQTYKGIRLPFEDESFDVVISNHVIEHVGSREQQFSHLHEISRVLVPGGYAYLATPSRWQFIEPHFRLPMLSWMPRMWRDAYVRTAGRGECYDCDLLRPVELRRLLDTIELPYRCLNVRALRTLVEIEQTKSTLARLTSIVPDRLLERLRNIFPTLIYLIYKPAFPESRVAAESAASPFPDGKST